MHVRKVITSSYDIQTNGGTERVNHTMAQMLTVAVNERQNDWDEHLPHIEFAYNNSVSEATGFAQMKCTWDGFLASRSPFWTTLTSGATKAWTVIKSSSAS